jgi:hypothetical protein
MSKIWDYQIRIYFDDEWSALVRNDPANPALAPLMRALLPYDARLKCQLDSFAEFLAEAEAAGETQSPLYKWTKATLDDPEKCARHRKAFAVQVAGQTVYPADIAEQLEAGLLPLVDGVRVTRVSKQDTNPDNNMPVPQEFR